ncbi:unnamed protein product [Lasius platythorax]|uniref:TonB C-terminal domain-containing protein n=1 Tax=Lasius platythorax TaxID=488582 RepID=A0AAV2NME3_9HYME
MDLRDFNVSSLECSDFYHWREHSHLCGTYRRAPVVGPELPTDPFWRACASIFCSPETPYSLMVSVNLQGGVREVTEVAPVSRDLAWRIPALCIERAFLGRQPFPYYKEVPDAFHISVESVRIDTRATPPASPPSSIAPQRAGH